MKRTNYLLYISMMILSLTLLCSCDSSDAPEDLEKEPVTTAIPTVIPTVIPTAVPTAAPTPIVTEPPAELPVVTQAPAEISSVVIEGIIPDGLEYLMDPSYINEFMNKDLPEGINFPVKLIRSSWGPDNLDYFTVWYEFKNTFGASYAAVTRNEDGSYDASLDSVVNVYGTDYAVYYYEDESLTQYFTPSLCLHLQKTLGHGASHYYIVVMDRDTLVFKEAESGTFTYYPLTAVPRE